MELSREFNAYQEFVLGCKLVWTRELYPELKARYRERTARVSEPPTTAAEVESLFAQDTMYQYFGWLERHLQRMKYSGRLGIAPVFETKRAELERQLKQPLPESLLKLTPDFEVPRYFSSVDIHQHPGGIWSDEIAGLVYERAAQTTTPLLGKHLDLHDRFTQRVLAERHPNTLVDIGCGFGKSTRAFYRELRDTQITAIDVAAPCLRLAAVRAEQDQASNVRFIQAKAEDTGLEAEGFDIVTSTMLIHEMPPPAIHAAIAESYRLLQPGGVAIHLDFLADDDPFNRFIHYGHARRNNEPYMPPLNEMDLVEAHEAVGFKNVRIEPFEEADGALAPDFNAWRFPWAVVVAEK